VTQTNATIGVVPRDGVRQRFHAVLGGQRLHLALDRDGFAHEQPLQLSRTLDRLAFTLESRTPEKHEAVLTIEGLPPGRYSSVAGEFTRRFFAERGQIARIQLLVNPGQPTTVRIEPDAKP
jgi:hypothetical protein